jgi:5-methyltetrahydropteroyltriglutamate--homocysteine methyltransferase
VCRGPVKYVGQDLLKIDIDNLRAAVEGLDVTEIFMPSTGPSGFGDNEYFATQEEYLHAVAEAMRDEYLAIVDAGFVLQVDDPWLISMLTDPSQTPQDRQRHASVHVEALNNALRGIPTDRIRHHTCYGLNHGPRLTDIPLKDALKFTFKINAGAYSFEVMNPRHMHEWRQVGEVGVPEGRVIIPGLLGHANNYVEHPELIAEYICNYAGIVGRENVIAGADCGFSSRATYATEVHPTVVWPKFKALAEGARIATKRLWK